MTLLYILTSPDASRALIDNLLYIHVCCIRVINGTRVIIQDVKKNMEDMKGRVKVVQLAN